MLEGQPGEGQANGAAAEQHEGKFPHTLILGQNPPLLSAPKLGAKIARIA